MEACLNVGLIHNRYQIRGGEDIVVENEMALLRDYSNLVRTYLVDSCELKGFVGALRAAVSMCYSFRGRRIVREWLRSSSLDLVHVHNTFPLISPSVFDALQAEEVPFVYTLHNFRTICPTSLLMLEGKACERSIRESAFWAVPKKVYRNSLLGTALVACLVELHKQRGTWLFEGGRFICLTEFAKGKFVEAGFPCERISVKPNFSIDYGFDPSERRENSALFVGRLSPEKGFNVALKAWGHIDFPLKVVGPGSVPADIPSSVELLGEKSHPEVIEMIKNCAFVVVPSLCYEGFPMAIVEAFSCGVPVLCSRLGSMAEVVDDGVTGLHFEAGDPIDLAEKVQWMLDNPNERRSMGENARKEYLEKYTPEKNYEMLMDIYQAAIEESGKR